jgi:hypothetical protein
MNLRHNENSWLIIIAPDAILVANELLSLLPVFVLS